MAAYLFGTFLILHGLVHLLYFAQSRRYVELQPELAWPDGAWAVAPIAGERRTRGLAGAGCVVAAMGFVAGGVALLAGRSGWQPLVVGSALVSALLYLLCWDGKLHDLDDQGGVGVLLNLVIVVGLIVAG